ncbi:MAG: SAM-dependent methyltransferase [Actinomadura sp.]
MNDAPHPPKRETPPGEIDTTVAHSARIWNYWLGGKDNYLIDRQIGDEFRKVFPDIVEIARSSRAFLARAVRHLAGEAQVRQFLDIGTGLPTVDNTHEIAQRVAPQSRVVYVDNDPMVLTHARALLTSAAAGTTEYIDADLRQPEAIMEAAAGTLDFTRPIGLVLMNVLGHIPDLDEARSIVTRLVDALPPGSYLTVADGTNVISGEKFDRAIAIWNESGSIPYTLRTPEEITGYFDGLRILEPGVVPCSRWRPDPSPSGPPAENDEFGAVGRKL